MDLLTTLVGVGVTILVAGVPWAFAVHGRLASIEAKLVGNDLLQRDMRRIETRLITVESRQQAST